MAILETFLQQQQPQKAENIKQIIVDVVSSLLPKNREVIEKRYGLKNPIPYTLDRIGKDMAVTRERIRQWGEKFPEKKICISKERCIF